MAPSSLRTPIKPAKRFASHASAGFAKLVAVYVVSLFGFVIWVGLVISWIFFHGVLPPLAQ